MNKERVETTPHYDDYDNVLFVWTGRKTVHLKSLGRVASLRRCEYEWQPRASTHLPDLKSYEYTFDVKAGEAVYSNGMDTPRRIR